MGLYINEINGKSVGVRYQHKIHAILTDGGHIWASPETPTPVEWEPNLVCVVDNGVFGAAMYVHNKSEFEAIIFSKDDRPKVWLTYTNAAKYAE